MTFIVSLTQAFVVSLFAVVAHVGVGHLISGGPLLDPNSLFAGTMVGALAVLPWTNGAA